MIDGNGGRTFGWKRWAAPALALAATGLLAGCNSSGSGTTPEGNASTGASPAASAEASASAGAGASPGAELKIAVIPKGTSHEYWKSVHAGAIKASQEMETKGTKVDILWKGTESEGDRNGQVSVVETFITQHVDGIVLAPLDKQALVSPVHDAAGRKIPVIVIDSALNGTDWTSFVATNNEKGGEMAGERLATLLNGKGKVIVLPYAQGSASTEDREKGFLTVMKKYPGITVLSSNQYGGPTTDTAYKTSQNLISRYKTQIDGVFASNETNTRGMRLALKDGNLLKKAKFVGFDAAEDLVTALKAGEIQGLIVQNPLKMGYTGVLTAVDAIQGKKVEKNIDSGVALVTPENVNSPENQEYLNPPLAQYLK